MATIYQITDRETGKMYIGCTTKPIDVRIYQHQTNHSEAKCSSYTIVSKGAYDVAILEKCPLETRFDCELGWIQKFGDKVVNKVGAQTREITSNRVGNRPSTYQKTGIKAESKDEYKKIYKETHKAAIQEYNGEYYAKNRTRLNEKVECAVCGGRYSKLTKWNHERTKRHENAAFAQQAAEVEQCVECVV